MRYTRYEYKKANKFKFLFSVIVIAAISITCGMYVSKFIFNGKEISENKLENSQEKSNLVKSEGVIAIQSGYYSKQENAQAALNTVQNDLKPFMVEEDGKYRIILGLYEQEEGIKKIDEFTAKGVSVAKIDLSIDSNTTENKKVIEVVDGFFKILNKLGESEVQSIKTSSYKEWANEIINDNDENKSEKLNDLLKLIQDLPEEINKSNNDTSMKNLYEFIKKYKTMS